MLSESDDDDGSEETISAIIRRRNNAKTKKRKNDLMSTEPTDDEVEETGKVLAQIMDKNDKEMENNINERGKRFKKVASSKSAKDLPKDLNKFYREEKLPNKKDVAITSMSIDHMIGAVSNSGQNILGETMTKIRLQEKKNERNSEESSRKRTNNNIVIDNTKKKTRKRRTRKDTRNDKQLKQQLAQREGEDYANGLIEHTTYQTKTAYERLVENNVMEMTLLKKTDTLESLPQRSLGDYNTRNEREGWMINTLKSIDKNELEITRQQPAAKKNMQFLRKIKDSAPFYEVLMKSHIESNKKVQEPELIDWDYASNFYREAILERGERICINSTNGACVAQRDCGFYCREFLKPTQNMKFIKHRIRDSETCQESLPMIQRMCLPCHQAVVGFKYWLRISKKNHKDDKTKMETGKSAILDDIEPLTDIQFDINHAGQYNIWCCIGVGDTEYHGVPGPFIPWDKDNYIVSETTLVGMTNESEKQEEKIKLMKRAYLRQKKLQAESNTGGLSNDMYRDSTGKLHHKDSYLNASKVMYSTSMGSPVPGVVSAVHSKTNPEKGQTTHTEQRRIKNLIQRECLHFQEGAIPARIESTKTYSRSIHTESASSIE